MFFKHWLSNNDVVEKLQQVPVFAWFLTDVAGNNFIELNSSFELSAAGCAITTDESVTKRITRNFCIVSI